MTLDELVEEVTAWADSKGWWEPQCRANHEGADLLTSQEGDLCIWLCKVCGAHALDMGRPLEWQFPEVAYRNTGEDLMLCVTELAEALEELRNHKGEEQVYWQTPHGTFGSFESLGVDGEALELAAKGYKPEGFPVEVVDLLIRVLDLWGHRMPNLSLEEVFRLKMTYNATRPYRHGGKAS